MKAPLPCVTFFLLVIVGPAQGAGPVATASSSTSGFEAAGAIDGKRFALDKGTAWQGQSGERVWWWQVRFPKPRAIGAILQISGDQPLVFRNAPKSYVWQISDDGKQWQDLGETAVKRETRMFRIHRCKQARTAQFLRLRIDAAEGKFPTLREVEVYAEPDAKIAFDDWFITVQTDEENIVSDKPDSFTKLARQCQGWEKVQVQQVWLSTFNEAFVSAEPRPVCAFLSGNLKDWCQRTREPWRGTQEVLTRRNLPMWAACGGAQGLAILSDVGVNKEWDCPHCRDPKNPELRIYDHIGHTAKKPCGDYSCCTFERGRYKVLQLAKDPVFAGLEREFVIMESHCGQIMYPPKGWMLVATKGQGGLTVCQCLRVKDRPIYAAQFHIEMPGTAENSQKIMSNFLGVAKKWGGYNPKAKRLSAPELWPGEQPQFGMK
jgi:hypothetical protein